MITENFWTLPDVAPGARHAEIWKVRRRSYEMLVRNVLPCEPQRILDLGAGAGWLSARLSALGHLPLAFDIVGSTEPWLVVEASFDNLPVKDASADFAIFNGSFHYSRDYERTLREASRVASTIVIMDTPIYQSRSSGERMVAELYPGSPYRQFLTWQELSQLGRWKAYRWYGLRAALRPSFAALRGRREPASFAVLVGQAAL